MEVLIQRKNVVFDATVLSTLQGCPLLSDFRFNHNLVSIGGKSSSLEMGSIVHTILEHFNKSIIEGKGRGNSIAIGMEKGKDLAFSEETRNAKPEDIDLVFNTMQEYFDYYKNDFWVPLEVEVVKTDKIYEDDEIRVYWKAKFDLIADTNQGIYSVDH